MIVADEVRARFLNPARVAQLADNIADHGLLSPITVRPDRSGTGYLLVCGGHRLAAVAELGWGTIPAFVRTEMSDEEARPPAVVALDVDGGRLGQIMTDDIAAHREALIFEVEIVLAGYWQDDKMPPRLRTAVLADWADELEEWPVDRVRAALRYWRRESPRLRPNPGDIARLLRERDNQRTMATWRAQVAEAERRAAAEVLTNTPPPMTPERHREVANEVARLRHELAAAASRR